MTERQVEGEYGEFWGNAEWDMLAHTPLRFLQGYCVL